MRGLSALYDSRDLSPRAKVAIMRSRLRNNITKEPSHRYILYELSINHDLTIIDIDALLIGIARELSALKVEVGMGTVVIDNVHNAH